MRPTRSTVLLSLIFVGIAAAQITLNPIPTRVIGQLSTKLTSVSPNLVEGRELQTPESIAIDTSTNPSPLYIADTANNRILGYRSALAFTNGQMADLVIGQPDFTTTVAAGPAFSTRTTGLSSPVSIAVDPKGNLYAVDAGNNRILRFHQPFSQSGTVFPDLVIGQPDFTTGKANQGGLSASSLNITTPSGITFDSSGNLWATDPGNNRILRYNASVLGASASSGPAADLVMGQANFTVNSEGTTAPPATSFSAIYAPRGIAFDAGGRLFVSDAVPSQRGRVLVWFPPFSTGQLATRMLGVDQSNPQPPTVSQYQFQQTPGALFAMGNQIGVSDTLNNRLMIFPPVEQWNLDNFFQAAITVVGQPDFSTGTANQGQPTSGASTLASPVGVFYYHSSLYVADAANNRVVVFPQNGSGFDPANSVLGQTQLNYNSPNFIEGREVYFSAGGDSGLAVDFSSDVPHLYISDSYNNRILGYYDLRNIKPGQYADIVIGQPDFFTSIGNYPNKQPNAGNLLVPTGLAVDPSGNLYVADSGNGRVLRFPSPFANFHPGTRMAVTESADLVLGQINFTTKITDATSQTMAAPYGLAFAGNNGLLVSDFGNNRVLYFAGSSQNLTSGQAAATVFGQTDMNSSGSGSALNRMSQPRHIAVDSDDRLYVADSANGRVLIFNRASAAGSGAFAALALTSGLSAPRGVNVNFQTGDIWVADPGANAAVRYPNFNRLIGSGTYTPNATLTDYAPLAVAEDNWGNVFLADNANRVLIYYPGLSALNAANYWGPQTTAPQPFPLAPGTITALYSTGGTGQFGTGSASATSIPLPKQLNGIQVTVNDTPAALFYAGPDQINFEVPSNAPQSGTADLQVIETATGRVLGDTTILMYSVSPGVFTQTATGSGDGAIANEDGTLNTSKNPAKAGSVITIYMTGQGYISGMPADGDISNAPLKTPYQPLVYLGDQNFVPEGNILYSGLAPTLVGVWQINVKIPNDVISLPATPTQVLVVANSEFSGGGGVGRPVYVYVKAP